jgi:hypothetical protein
MGVARLFAMLQRFGACPNKFLAHQLQYQAPELRQKLPAGEATVELDKDPTVRCGFSPL